MGHADVSMSILNTLFFGDLSQFSTFMPGNGKRGVVNRVIQLAQGVGRVNLEVLPEESDCWLAELTNREVHIVRAFLFPFAGWQTRHVRPVADDRYAVASDGEWATLFEEIEVLDHKLGGGLMSCTEIREGLEALAVAIAGLGDHLGQDVNVNCGGGGGSCGGLLGQLSEYTPAQMTEQTGIEEPDPEGAPPEGFDTWEEYFDRKCKASHALFAWVRNLLSTMQGASGAAATMAVFAPLIAGWVATTGVVFPPAAVVLLAVSVVGVAAISVYAFGQLNEAIDWLDANKDVIVCSLYTSGSALDAQNVIADAVEDALEAIEWAGALAPLAGQLNTALAAALSQAVNTNVVNVLFYAAEDILLPDVTCDCEPEQSEWQFDADEEGWFFYSGGGANVEWEYGWTAASEGADGGDSSPGRLWAEVDRTVEGEGNSTTAWRYEWESGAPVATEGMRLYADLKVTDVEPYVAVYLQMFYEDDTYESFFQNATTGWEEWYITVSPGNVGKTIKLLNCQCAPGSTTLELVRLEVDNVRLVA